MARAQDLRRALVSAIVAVMVVFAAASSAHRNYAARAVGRTRRGRTLKQATDGGAEPVGGRPAEAFVLPYLPYPYNALEPVIDTQTMRFHHDNHHATYVKNLNAKFGPVEGTGNDTLVTLLEKVGSGDLPRDQATTVRNNGGGHWNHAMWWKLLSPPNSTNTSTTNISPQLQQAINQTFNSTSGMLAELKATADAHFGSGWAWLCVNDTGKGSLDILDTTNQENPIMPVVRSPPCIPILAVDVWEHAFYLKYGPAKANYTRAVQQIINWQQVSDNYDAARRGDIGFIGATF